MTPSHTVSHDADTVCEGVMEDSEGESLRTQAQENKPLLKVYDES